MLDIHPDPLCAKIGITTRTRYGWRNAGSRNMQQRAAYRKVVQPRHKTYILEHRLSSSNKGRLGLPCCVRYHPSPSLILTQVSTSTISSMPTTMSSNSVAPIGVKISTFLRDEKNSCKQIQKKILSRRNPDRITR